MGERFERLWLGQMYRDPSPLAQDDSKSNRLRDDSKPTGSGMTANKQVQG
jgi:hypothetical protein